MSTFWYNIVIINVSISILYITYKAFFSRDTFLILKRFYLKYSLLFAVFIPIMDMSGFLKHSQELTNLLSEQSFLLPELVVTTNQQPVINTQQIVIGLYFLVAFVLIIRFFIRLISIQKIQAKSTKTIIDGTPVYVLGKNIAPFSFLNRIFVNPALHTPEELQQILTHEKIHVKQGHTFDVIIAEIITIAFWFNPFTWLMKREIRENLEYIADNKVITSGFDTKHYQYHLLQLSYQTPDLKLTNQFNFSPLKKRIKMMNRKKSMKASAAKYLLVAPLALMLVIAGNFQAIAGTVKNMNEASAENAIQNKPVAVNNVPANLEMKITTSTTAVEKETPAPEGKKEQKKPEVASEKIIELTVVGYGSKVNTKAPENENLEQDDKTTFTVVEKMPEYPGGQNELMKFLMSNIKYPVKAQELGIQGRVFVQFVINTDGSISDIEVVRSVNPALDTEAIRIVKAMPKWTPGMQKGKNVRVNYTLPINFRLQGDEKAPKPLVVIDGEVKPADFDFNTLNPNEVSEVSVLKDDAATRIYGEKGKNGVMIITMKKDK